MKDDIIIRKVKPSDAEQYIKLNNLVWRYAYKHIFPEEVFVDRDANAYKKINDFKNKVYNDDSRMVYVAEVCGKIIGLISGSLVSNYEYFANQGYADLMALYIHPDYHGVGLGTKFKDMFVNWAKEKGATKFVIGVLKENYKARKVYEKWGGKLHEHTQPFEKLGVNYDEVFYTYEIK